jgi:ubiquinone/menaquinone biosynthesis C-methylase UbiE
MNEQEVKKYIERYEKRYSQYGTSPLTLGWKDRESQWLRFKILCEVGISEGDSILDVGCGFGDFLLYLKERGIKNIKYEGWDIVPLLIKEAERLHKDSKNAIFELKNIFLEPAQNKKFDWVVASGVLNARIKNNSDKMKGLIKIMLKMCRKGIAINMLTNYVDFMREDLFYYSPEEMFTFSKSLTKRVSLRHDYPLYEFTLYLYKD